jgi:RHS repeat-associated protein
VGASKQLLRWKGRPFESAAGGVYDMRARWWSPAAGQFLTVDRLEYFDATSTLWGWGNQSPARWSDPSGRCPACVGFAVGGEIGFFGGAIYYAATADINQSAGDFFAGVFNAGLEGAAIGAALGVSGVIADTALSGGTFADLVSGAGTAGRGGLSGLSGLASGAAGAAGAAAGGASQVCPTNIAGKAQTAASVADKLARYLLNPDHPVGGSKAAWFDAALGFTQENASQLAEQIQFDADTAVETGVTQFGTQYNQTITIVGANGNVSDVVFGWILNNDGVVRLVTAIPTKQ